MRNAFLTFILAANSAASIHANTPADLAAAAEAQDWSTIASLLVAGSAPTAPDATTTALHWAVIHQHVPTIQLLLAARSNPNAKTEYDITPLHIACTLQNPELVERLLNAGADANLAQPGGETPLMTAARTGIRRTVELLIQSKAALDAKERKGQTALMWAAAAGNAEAADALITAGADIKAASDLGFTAMMFAARDGHPDVVELLYKAGIDINAIMQPERSGVRTPRKGTSALTLAVESGHFELAMQLVRCGANPNDQRSGFTPLHALSWVRKPARGEDPNGDPPPRGSGRLTSLQFVREIVAAGADVNARLIRGKSGKAVLSHKGATPFLFASWTADLSFMETLLELGADPAITNDDGCHALMAASGIGVRAVGEEAGTESEVIRAIELLIQQGLDVNTVDDNKETAMHGAAYRNFPVVVDFLAKNGADPKLWNHKNKSGWTPVMIAEGHRPGSFKPSPVTVAALQRAMSP